MKGKAKDLFEEWFSVDLENEKGLHDYQIPTVRERKISIFNSLSSSFQWGVMQDFYDSQGIYIVIDYYINLYNDKILWEAEINHNLKLDIDFKTRQEARKAALEKAEEILNDRQ